MDLLVPDRSYAANCIWRSVVDAVSTAVWRPPRIGSGTTTDGLYTLYTADLTYVVERHGICLHQYSDDSKVYVSVPISDVTTAIQRLAVCVSSINDWMSASRLRLNPTKTEVIWLGASQQVSRINIGDIPMLSTTIKVAESARDLAVIQYQAELTLFVHAIALC